LGDFFVNDAFAAAHRQQPTIVGFTELLPSAAGLVMERELNALNKVLTSNLHPCIAILGGAKVKDSLDVAENMLKNKIADKVLATGLVANIFLLAEGKNLGSGNLKFLASEFKDLKEITETAKHLLKKFKTKIELPVDVAVNEDGTRQLQSIKDLPSDYLIHDIGLETIVKFSSMLKDAKVIIANGPAGVFELNEFSFGTNELFLAIANSKAYSVLGGGETLASIDKLGIADDLDHISTGGGACINYLAGRKLPGVEALKNSKKIFKKKLEK
jgi:phosphoglycerate kinase